MCVSFRSVLCVATVSDGEEKGKKEDCRPSASFCASHSGSETRGHSKKRKFAHTEGPITHGTKHNQPFIPFVWKHTFSDSYVVTDAWPA